MPTKKPTDFPPTDLVAVTLRTWRNEADMTHEEIAVRISDRLPRAYRVSREKIRRMESGEVPAWKMETLVLQAWAEVTGHHVLELADSYAQDMAQLSERTRDFESGSKRGQVKSGNRCKAESEGSTHNRQRVAA